MLLADDLSARLCGTDTGFNGFEIYSGVKLCKDRLIIFDSLANGKPP